MYYHSIIISLIYAHHYCMICACPWPSADQQLLFLYDKLHNPSSNYILQTSDMYQTGQKYGKTTGRCVRRNRLSEVRFSGSMYNRCMIQKGSFDRFIHIFDMNIRYVAQTCGKIATSQRLSFPIFLFVTRSELLRCFTFINCLIKCLILIRFYLANALTNQSFFVHVNHW